MTVEEKKADHFIAAEELSSKIQTKKNPCFQVLFIFLAPVKTFLKYASSDFEKQ